MATTLFSWCNAVVLSVIEVHYRQAKHLVILQWVMRGVLLAKVRYIDAGSIGVHETPTVIVYKYIL
jgi:hypothetical protein